MQRKTKTVGVSPKAPAAAGAAVLVGLLAGYLGVDADWLVAVLSAIGALAGAVAARPGVVAYERETIEPSPWSNERGQVLYVLLVILAIILIVWLLAPLV
jgi:hypothetical protein